MHVCVHTWSCIMMYFTITTAGVYVLNTQFTKSLHTGSHCGTGPLEECYTFILLHGTTYIHHYCKSLEGQQF